MHISSHSVCLTWFFPLQLLPLYFLLFSDFFLLRSIWAVLAVPCLFLFPLFASVTPNCDTVWFAHFKKSNKAFFFATYHYT